jgi:hypothetical protein
MGERYTSVGGCSAMTKSLMARVCVIRATDKRCLLAPRRTACSRGVVDTGAPGSPVTRGFVRLFLTAQRRRGVLNPTRCASLPDDALHPRPNFRTTGPSEWNER